MLTQEEINILNDAQEANPHWMNALIKCASIMAERRKKYSGNNHPYYNFVDVARRTDTSVIDVFNHHIAVKESRQSTTKEDFSDERYVDTIIDTVNFYLLKAGWLLDNLSEDDVLPPISEEEWEELWPIICLDFDGVVNKYDGWRGHYELFPARPRVEEFLRKLKELGYNIVLCTARTTDNIITVVDWLKEHNLYDYFSKITNVKPPAVTYVDDRAITFKGDFDETLNEVIEFQPFWREDSSEKDEIQTEQT